MARKWEYLPVSRPMDMREAVMEESGHTMTYEWFLEHLNELGDDGWEIISATPVEREGDKPWVEYMLKRPKED